jgi:(1->4)-alpha-D-glucan 1-alpha-D-glucosylmutase
LQFNQNFRLNQGAELTDYLSDLGISDCYASPIFAARPGSLHGYDVTDHTKLNSEIGGREGFIEFAKALKEREMGLVIDVVPNHMCISGTDNVWWGDILENGPSSPFATFFDIDWHPPNQNLINKVLLPVLGDQYGRVLENQEIQLSYQRGAFFVKYYETKLPLAPRTLILILKSTLELVSSMLREFHPHRLELESIITALEHLPPRTETDPEKVKERRREKEVTKRRLSALINSSGKVRQALNAMIEQFNGIKGEPDSFNRLEELLGEQAYRLCYWRVATDEINYRRFFDINELAAIRVEEPKVFTAAHNLVFRLLKDGFVTGLRIDHIDGLYDPEGYLKYLQRGCLKSLREANTVSRPTRPRQTFTGDIVRPCYVVVEKVLGYNEKLRASWAAHGTTGYDFLNLLNGLFVDGSHEILFSKVWQRITGSRQEFNDVAYESKKLVLHAAMSGELHVLARKLDRISEQHRYSRDFTFNSLHDALGEIIACFPVYRSYIHAKRGEIGNEDRRYIATAVHNARRRNPASSPSIYEFIKSVLLLEEPDRITDEQRNERHDFVMRFQQLTGPVTAKGIEDTACYRYYPLVSLCEVGGDPSRFGVSIKTFHERNQERLAHWPQAMLATSTHDTKRSEDARARINVLSEIPTHWYRAIRRWQKLNDDLKTLVDGIPVPNASEEYLIYQTLIGVWPHPPVNVDPDPERDQSFIQRIQDYLTKAMREAKIHSSWLSPNEEYEVAFRQFIERILAPGALFAEDFNKFQTSVTRAGIFNSLSQTLLKITVPGVPDFYQGTELWDLSLVDPDNRRPVDYSHRRSLLASIRLDEEKDRAELVDELIRNPEDGRIKLFVTKLSLDLRHQNRELFERGEYIPLQPSGERNHHVIVFARKHGERAVIVVASRFFSRLANHSRLPIGGDVWDETSIAIPQELAGCYRDHFTGHSFCAKSNQKDKDHVLQLADVCANLPLALLERRL